MQRNKLYALLALACVAGYVLLFFSIYTEGQPNSGFTTCMLKQMTGIPCPSCGSTRAVRLLAHGEIYQSVMMNPFGIIVAVIMIIVPIWMLYDVILNKQTLLDCYRKIEITVRIKWIAILLIVLVAVNWYWNIQKNL